MDFWAGVPKIVCSARWTRVWTLQEVVLPPEVWLLYGRSKAHWDLFARFSRNSTSHATTCCEQSWITFPMDLRKDINNPWFALTLSIDRARNLQKDEHSVSSFYEILLCHQGRSSQWPQDRVFGFLGLADPFYGSLDLDYTLPTRKIYQRTSSRLLEVEGMRCLTGSWFISHDFRGGESRLVGTLPS